MAGRGEFFVTEGTLSEGAACYVVRQADQDLLNALSRGEFAYVLDSRQKGKSSLMIRAREALESSGTRTVLLDLQRFGSNLDPDRWYASMLQVVGEQLDIEDRLFEIWDAQVHAGPMRKFFAALETGLGELGAPCVVFVDEIDFVRSLPFSTDEFFAGIRECLNRRAGERVEGSGERVNRTDPSVTPSLPALRPPSPDTRSLTFCLLGVATPSELIRDVRITPFNVGKRIELTDFTLAELAPYEAPLSEGGRNGMALLKRIHHWTAGHPYLTQKLASAVASDFSVKTAGGVDRLVETLFFSLKARSEEPNLADVARRVLESPIEGIAPDEARARVLDLYRQVRDSRVRDDDTDPVVAVLKLSGLTRVLEGYLMVRNRVYFRAFDKSWVEANLPEAELLRQKKAAHRASLRTATFAVTSLLGLFGVPAAVYAYWLSSQNAELAEQRRLALVSLKDEKARADQSAATSARLAGNEKQARQRSDQVAAELAQQGRATEAALAEARSQRAIAANARDESLKSALEAKNQAQLARRESARADEFRDAAYLSAYASKMNLMGATWQAGDYSRFKQLLDETESFGRQRFEWNLWKSLSEGPPVRVLPGVPNSSGTHYLTEKRIVLNDSKRTAITLQSTGGSTRQLGWTRDPRYAFKLGDDLVVYDSSTGHEAKRIPTQAQRVLPLYTAFDYIGLETKFVNDDATPVNVTYLSSSSSAQKWSRAIVVTYPGARQDLLSGRTLTLTPNQQHIILQSAQGEITAISLADGSTRLLRPEPSTLVEMAIGRQFKSLTANTHFIAALSTTGVLTLRDSAFKLLKAVSGEYACAIALEDGLFVIAVDGKAMLFDVDGNQLASLFLRKGDFSEVFENYSLESNGNNEIYLSTIGSTAKSLRVPNRHGALRIASVPLASADALQYKISEHSILTTYRSGESFLSDWSGEKRTTLATHSYITASSTATDMVALGCNDGTLLILDGSLHTISETVRLSDEPIGDILCMEDRILVGTFSGDIIQLRRGSLQQRVANVQLDYPVSCFGPSKPGHYLIADWLGNVYKGQLGSQNYTFLQKIPFVPWKLWQTGASIVALSTSECAVYTSSGSHIASMVFDSPITDYDRTPDGSTFVVLDAGGKVRVIESSGLRDLGTLPVTFVEVNAGPFEVTPSERGLVHLDKDGGGIKILIRGKLLRWRWHQ